MSWRVEWDQYVLNLVRLFPGKQIYLDPVYGSDGNDGSIQSPVKTLKVAYGMARAGRNDVIFAVGGNTALVQTAAFTWAKNYTHLVGLGPELHNGQRTRITMGANMTPFFTISARGCIFKNIHWQYGRGSAANLVGLSLTYSGNACVLFDNCDIEGPLNATEGAAAFNLINIANGTQDLTFRKCRIGDWTTPANYATGPGYLINFGGNNAVQTFEDCTIMGISTADWIPINTAVNIGGEGGMVQFTRCRFINCKQGTAYTKVFATPANGFVSLHDCMRIQFTSWGAVGAAVYCTMPAADKAGALGIENS
jgi:hypothetical protein